jgi:hypothetical protein
MIRKHTHACVRPHRAKTLYRNLHHGAVPGVQEAVFTGLN